MIVASSEERGLYFLGAFVVGGITFVIAWIYAIVTYGFFLGVGLGWIPAAIIGVVVGLLWPLVVLAILGIVALILFNK